MEQKKETIEILKDLWRYEHSEYSEKDIRKALDIAIKALEKQIPQKPEYIADGYSDGELVYDMAKCPNCGNDDYEYDYGNWGKPFCPECGQALNWSKEK